MWTHEEILHHTSGNSGPSSTAIEPNRPNLRIQNSKVVGIDGGGERGNFLMTFLGRNQTNMVALWHPHLTKPPARRQVTDLVKAEAVLSLHK